MNSMTAFREELTELAFKPTMSKEAGIRSKLLEIASRRATKATSNAKAAVSVAKAVKDQPAQFASLLKRDGVRSTAKRLKRMHALRTTISKKPLGA